MPPSYPRTAVHKSWLLNTKRHPVAVRNHQKLCRLTQAFRNALCFRKSLPDFCLKRPASSFQSLAMPPPAEGPRPASPGPCSQEPSASPSRCHPSMSLLGGSQGLQPLFQGDCVSWPVPLSLHIALRSTELAWVQLPVRPSEPFSFISPSASLWMSGVFYQWFHIGFHITNVCVYLRSTNSTSHTWWGVCLLPILSLCDGIFSVL